MPEDNAQAADETRKLRARFPRWGILFDLLESVWVAVRGKRTLVAASNPGTLTERMEAAARGERGARRGRTDPDVARPPGAGTRLATGGMAPCRQALTLSAWKRPAAEAWS